MQILASPPATGVEPSSSASSLRMPFRRSSSGVVSAVLQNVGVLTVANGFRALAILAQGILVARLLDPKLYGVASLVLAYPTLVLEIFSARSSDVAVKYVGTFHARGDRERLLAVCKWTLTIDLAIALVSFLFVIATGWWVISLMDLGADASLLMFVAAAAFFPGALENTSFAVLTVLERFPVVAGLQSFSAALRAVLVVGLVLGGFGVAGVIWGGAIAASVASLCYGVVAWTQMRRAWGAGPVQGSYGALRGQRREIFGFLVYNDLSALVGIVPKQLDLLLLGYFRMPVEVGYYKLAKSLASSVGYLVEPLQSVAYPALVRLWNPADRRPMSDVLGRLRLHVGLPLGALGLIGLLVVPTLVRAGIGEAYTPAIPATQILLFGAIVWLSVFWLRPTFLARGMIEPWLRINSLVSGLLLVAYPLAAFYGGYLGVCACTVGGSLLGQALALHYLRRSDAREHRCDS